LIQVLLETIAFIFRSNHRELKLANRFESCKILNSIANFIMYIFTSNMSIII